MPYIAFLDMLGTRASALISNTEYEKAINDFNSRLETLSEEYQCKVYGYSDNAYVELKKISDLVLFFRYLRDSLMMQHRYFAAAVDWGTLDATGCSNGNFHSMKFTAPATVDIYKMQCQFSGIGISLSEKVVHGLKEYRMDESFCSSIYQKAYIASGEPVVSLIYDLSYDSVSIDRLKYIIDDYLLTSATDVRAGRYYLTPLISMIKSLNVEEISQKLRDIVSLLSFSSTPDCFKSLPNNEWYSQYFLFALVERVFLLREKDTSLNANQICTEIIRGYNINGNKLVSICSTISPAIISNENKRNFLKTLYNMNT